MYVCFDCIVLPPLGMEWIGSLYAQAYLSALLNHRNQYSGNLMKDEPTILAFETGNELMTKGQPFDDWANEIATFLKVCCQHNNILLAGKNQKAKLEMQSLCIDQTKPRHEPTSFNSSLRIEYPQLVEFSQKLCVLEDFSFTQPILIL